MLVDLQKHATREKLVVLSVNWPEDYKEFLQIKGRDGRIAAIHVGYTEEDVPLLVEEINSTWAKTSAESSGK